ncbi:TolC family protein [Parabacteroides acidifaciens]|uniref:TolC family protein n=1 Tax=Parabacteroides acidifaciens TaxID=2290935 RepID=A0A3D8HFL9_9BACT|nr:MULTISPECIES: TolC family protein [Parabacteroides]MBC8601458.1 TolC family protein [Parabacteroides acidifaciens]RDU49784.1 transporter [Parabacteroides acidifaciens]RHO74852.1 transporter [Parabacteroides sp. AF48-14]RHR51816.1 transporter [Parabacteroides sp. AF17-28]
MKTTFILLLIFSSIHCIAQKKKSYTDNATVVEVSANSESDSIQAMLDDYERIQLPPLSVFLQSVYEHPSVKIYEARRDEANAEREITHREWLNYLRLQGTYQYGRNNLYSTSITEGTPVDPIISNVGNNQNLYNVGVSVSIPIGDLTSRKQKNRVKKAQYIQLQSEYEMSVEERKLMILQAYNNVLQQLATLKAKSDAAALYNAQMKISEQDFINGKIDITSLSLERGRRSSAVITYQEGRAALHNAVTLLEMLTNVKIINRSNQEE